MTKYTPKLEELKNYIDSSGMTITAISERMGMTRTSFYNKLSGNTEFTVSEMLKLTTVLHMPNGVRNKIFLL